MAEIKTDALEITMGKLLRVGVIVCCGIMTAGAILFLWRHGSEAALHTGFTGEPATLRSVTGVVRLALDGSAAGIIQLAALAMIATPVARVAFSVLGFAKLQDWRFVGVSLVVLALLGAGLFGRG